MWNGRSSTLISISSCGRASAFYFSFFICFYCWWSSGSVLSFTSAGATALPAPNPAPAFGLPSPAQPRCWRFGSTLPNDQMKDANMTDDPNQSANVLALTFGQPPFPFGSHNKKILPFSIFDY